MTETPDLQKAALDIIDAQKIMTIATSASDSPWAAPVYYIYHKNAFYFFSKETSRHITAALNTEKAAVSIFFDSSSWSDIRGLQMEGRIKASGIASESGHAFNAYIKKYNFISDIKNAASSKDDIVSIEAAFNVKFYKFTPTFVYYTDNSIRYGFREKVDLSI